MSNTLRPEAWVTLYGDYLFSMAMIRIGNKEIAEDLVQDTFLSAYKGKENFKGDSSEKTWLTAILKNKIIDYYRKKDVLRNTNEYLTETEESFYGSFFSTEEERSGHWTTSAAPKEWDIERADSQLNKREFNKILQDCVQKMPSKLAPVFLAKFLEDQDSDKICKDFNISSSNYWTIIHRAKVLMRSCLEKSWFDAK